MLKDWPSRKKESLNCQFLCYKYSHGWFQAIKMMPLNMRWEETCIASPGAGCRQLHHTRLTCHVAVKTEDNFTRVWHIPRVNDSWITNYLLAFPLQLCLRFIYISTTLQYVLKGWVWFICFIFILTQNLFLAKGLFRVPCQPNCQT